MKRMSNSSNAASAKRVRRSERVEDERSEISAAARATTLPLVRRELLGFSHAPEQQILLHVWSGVSAAVVQRDQRESAEHRETRFLETANGKLRAVCRAIMGRYYNETAMPQHFTVIPIPFETDPRFYPGLIFEASDDGAILRDDTIDSNLRAADAIGTCLPWHLLAPGDIRLVVYDVDDFAEAYIYARDLAVEQRISWVDSIATLLRSDPSAFVWENVSHPMTVAQLMVRNYEIHVEVRFPATSRGDGTKCSTAPAELLVMFDHHLTDDVSLSDDES